MTVLILDPHGDDCALFCAYTAMREKALIWVTHPTVPEREIRLAADSLECDHKMGYFSMSALAGDFQQVYAPHPDPDGHQGHNEVGELAVQWFGAEKVRFYTTYAPRGQRTRTENEVPYEPWMVARKLRALSCFESQIEQESTRPWFTYLLDVREWYA